MADNDEFNRALRDGMQRVAETGLNKIGSDLQQALDEVKATHGGKPVEEVAPALRSALEAHDMDLPDEHFNAYAESISEGRRVVIEVKKPNLNA
jgi:hypothetical protein